MNGVTKLFAGLLALVTVGLVMAQQDGGRGGDGGAFGRRGGAMATLTVRGDAQLDKPADQLQISLSVVNDGKEAAEVLDENNKMTQNVIDAMLKAGLEKKEYQTGGLNVSPIYSHRPRTADENWRPEVVGFRASHRLNIKTTKLELIGKIIDAASDAGVNQIDSINFGLSDHRAHREESIKAATANAIADARVMAEAANVRLARIVSINLDNAQAQVMRQEMMMGRAVAMDADGPPIEAGDVTIHASVTVVYEIEPAN